jgi:hypothetical protein
MYKSEVTWHGIEIYLTHHAMFASEFKFISQIPDPRLCLYNTCPY